MDQTATILAIAGALLVFGGPLAGYLYYRFRFKKQVDSLNVRERQIRTKRFNIPPPLVEGSKSGGHTAEIEDTIHILREDIEQKNLELSIVRQDYEMEIQVLRDENASLRQEIGKLRGEPVEVRDIVPDPVPESPQVVEVTEYYSTVSSEEAKADDVVGPKDDAYEYLFPDESGTEAESEHGIPETSESADFYDLEIVEEISEPETDHPVDEPEDEKDTDTETEDEMPPAEKDADRESSAVRFDRPPKVKETRGSQKSDTERPHSPIPLPTFTPVFELLGGRAENRREMSSVRSVVGLSDDQFEILTDLGYASLDKIACLSSSEVQRLAEIFKLTASVIETDWITNAQLQLFERDE